jgi:hypothetical protein
VYDNPARAADAAANSASVPQQAKRRLPAFENDRRLDRKPNMAIHPSRELDARAGSPGGRRRNVIGPVHSRSRSERDLYAGAMTVGHQGAPSAPLDSSQGRLHRLALRLLYRKRKIDAIIKFF